MRTRYLTQGAEFDPDRIYRYRLWRTWAPEGKERKGLVLWIMLNPSTADEHVLDPTLRRCESFSRCWGYEGFVVCNLFPLRSTDPKMLAAHSEPAGPKGRNTLVIEAAASWASRVIVGWGAHRMAVEAGAHLLESLGDTELWCLGHNGDGSPKHPLYLGSTSIPIRFEPKKWLLGT